MVPEICRNFKYFETEGHSIQVELSSLCTNYSFIPHKTKHPRTNDCLVTLGFWHNSLPLARLTHCNLSSAGVESGRSWVGGGEHLASPVCYVFFRFSRSKNVKKDTACMETNVWVLILVTDVWNPMKTFTITATLWRRCTGLLWWYSSKKTLGNGLRLVIWQ